MGSRAIVNIGVQQFVITRPRRFGKTLNMSMVDCFFPTSMQAGKICSKGLKFGRHTDICNPWSVVSFIGKKGKYDAYWSNTSGNGRINSLVQGRMLVSKRQWRN